MRRAAGVGLARRGEGSEAYESQLRRMEAAFRTPSLPPAADPLHSSPRPPRPLSRISSARGWRSSRRRPPISTARDARNRGPCPHGRARLCDREHAPDHPPDAGRLLAPAAARGQRGRTDAEPGADRAPSRQARASGSRLRAGDLRALAADAADAQPPLAAHPGARHPSRPEPRHAPARRRPLLPRSAVAAQVERLRAAFSN